MSRPPALPATAVAVRGQAELHALEALHARASGRRDTLNERRGELIQSVALAKGRLALKGDVEKFIEQLQHDAHVRALQKFEVLLNSIIKEVLPTSTNPIALELSVERGLPALDISMLRQSGALEDVYQDNGGALTNVVSMALRMIAVVKSGGAKFLSVDEPDCWIKPDRVPAFYAVIEDAARRLGVQCLAVSHHDPAVFGPTVAIAELQGSPETAVTVASTPSEWSDDQDGFRFIRLVNAQTYADTTLHLAPGLNCLTGTNGFGKSTFNRMLRAVFYGDCRDSLIRDSAKTLTVEIGLKGGRLLRFTREAKRNPRNIWSLHEADGVVVEDNGQHHETGGKSPPPWLDALFGIVRTESLDIHLMHQKEPTFLLDKPAAQRAAVLSIGQEAGYTRDMMAIHKERCLKDAALVREGEREIGRVDQSLKELEGLAGVSEALDRARAYVDAMEEWRLHLAAVEAIHGRVAAAALRVDAARARQVSLAGLPEADRLRALRDDAARAETRERVGQRLLAAIEREGEASARRSVLEVLPEGAPRLDDTDGLARIAERLPAAATRLASAARRADVLAGLPSIPTVSDDGGRADLLRRLTAAGAAARDKGAAAEAAGARLSEVRSEVEASVADGGGRCPTCGGATNADEILSAHVHAA